MRLTTNTTALLAAAALGAAAAHLEAAGALLEAPDAPATASFHLTAGPVSITLHAAVLGGQRAGSPARVPAGAHLVLGVAVPDLGLRAVHRVSYAAPERDGGGAATRLAGALASARLRASISWQAAG
ncbi:hypothetical protein WME89_08695 [Sorangium sp. So ce321]|uniref:hypothetical protein n=1 Tax=Sorangium sp. So ce321 TaxID=3133300 RepID=UPI003F63B455